MKHLIKKFSLNQIREELHKHNWILPSASEIRSTLPTPEYDVVWIRDLPEDKADWPTHGCIYDIRKDKIEVCNKSFMMNILVIRGDKPNGSRQTDKENRELKPATTQADDTGEPRRNRSEQDVDQKELQSHCRARYRDCISAWWGDLFASKPT